jgi:UDP-N-acetylglucosamine--N-acetylmuramyl-(pentapeptide) pyrophosphoryl-undecaprenol N-acetylglucosamine transferase
VTTYLLAGGGTAGHVNPLLALADRLKAREPDSIVLVLGTSEGLEARLVPERGYELLTIAKLPFPRRLNRVALGFPRQLLATVAEVREIIRARGVDVVVGFGGYASAPAYVAARWEQIPVVVHEANARPGMANRLGSFLTRYVGVASSRASLWHAQYVGMPLRREIEELDRTEAKAQALRLFDLDGSRPVLLVTGGSTGARRINQTISAVVPLILGSGWQVLHIAGTQSETIDPQLAGYRLIGYCDQMHLALAVANLAVSRAGAATVSEFTAIGLPAVYVPYPVGNGEQRLNVAAVVTSGGGLLVSDAEFTPQWFARTVIPLLRDPARISEMGLVSAQNGSRGGTDRLANLVGEALAQR